MVSRRQSYGSSVLLGVAIAASLSVGSGSAIDTVSALTATPGPSQPPAIPRVSKTRSTFHPLAVIKESVRLLNDYRCTAPNMRSPKAPYGLPDACSLLRVPVPARVQHVICLLGTAARGGVRADDGDCHGFAITQSGGQLRIGIVFGSALYVPATLTFWLLSGNVGRSRPSAGTNIPLTSSGHNSANWRESMRSTIRSNASAKRGTRGVER
jgi:hypothetical protein